jgi:transcriptional regulator with XRE-family HTH domain
MSVTVEPVTLKRVLARHGITTLKQFTRALGISRQHAWAFWSGRVGVGKLTMARLHKEFGIPLEELMAIESPSDPKPRGRPKHQREASSA